MPKDGAEIQHQVTAEGQTSERFDHQTNFIWDAIAAKITEVKEAHSLVYSLLYFIAIAGLSTNQIKKSEFFSTPKSAFSSDNRVVW